MQNKVAQNGDGNAVPMEQDTHLDAWCLRQQALDPLAYAHDETRFALASGVLGVRGGFEEEASATDGSFLASVYEQSPIHYHERLAGFARSTDTRVPVADGKRIQIWLGEHRLVPSRCQWLSFERELDFRTGRLQRRLRLRTPQGATIEIHAERVLPFAESALLAIRYRVHSIDYEGPIILLSSLEGGHRAVAQGDDPRIGVATGEGLLTTAVESNARYSRLSQRTARSGIEVSCEQRHRLRDGGLMFVDAQSDDSRAGQRFQATLKPGQHVCIEKFVGYAVEAQGQACQALIDATLERALAQGFDGLATAQEHSLQAFWQQADLSVSGDNASLQALRFNLFHLLQSAGRDGVHGTAAKGLTGEGYEGHCFWDTETYVLPVLVFTAPQVAKAMLRYRHRSLAAARLHAREMNHPQGALYPWRTIAGGECSAHYPSGSAAYHINAAIAYAIGLYLDATGDTDFMIEAGAEVLFETARIWMQVGHFNPRRGGAFCIHEVTGPDEYTALVNNNFYTNRLAQQHLQRAAQVWNLLQQEHGPDLTALAARLALEPAEVEQWQQAAVAMYLPYDADLGIHAQDDEFLDKPRWPFPKLQGEHRPLLLDYHPLTLYRYQICKQADAVMALVLAGQDIEADRKRRSFDYYEAITTHDSTLSASMFGILASEVGHADKAWCYFQDNLRVDLDDLHGNTSHGAHMAAMAGSWLGLVQGFAGLRVHAGQLLFAPTLPAAWPAYGFTLRWRKRVLRVDVSAEGARYRLHAGDPLEICHNGHPLQLSAHVSAAQALAQPGQQAKAKFPRAARALVFDLDGVLTDTAHTHYQAWKQLADEIGVPFDLQINERLKGVDRMASLAIILERAQRSYDEEQRRTLAERKNRYYVQAIQAFGPDDLFVGVGRLLQDARAAGLKIGLASASRNAGLLLQRLGIADCFDYVANAAEIRHSKPDPEIFLNVAAALGVPPSLCVGVEDAAAGIEAIHAAGMAAIGIGKPQELAQADAVLARVADLRLEDFVKA